MTSTSARSNRSDRAGRPAPDGQDASAETTAGAQRSGGSESTPTAHPFGRGAGGKAGWFAGLDGLRAIAAFGVLVTHVSLASGYYRRDGTWGELAARGEVGVAVFFVLSGFLLYRPFVGARLDGRPPMRMRRYLRHRFLRIFPAYWLALTVLAVVFNTRPGRHDFRWPWDDFGSSLWDFVTYYGLLQSFSEKTVVGGLQQAWTLHNEVFFYLLLPLWAAGAAWLGRRLARRQALALELGILAVLAVASLSWRMWLQSVRVSTGIEDFDPRFHWLIGNFHMFVPGMALALGLEWSRRRETPLRLLELLRRHPLACWALSGLAFWVVSTRIGLGIQVGAESPAEDLGKETLYATVGFFLVAPVALAGSMLSSSVRWLSSRLMVTLGLLSYGIYLWHVGIIDIYYKITDRDFFIGGPLPQMLAITVLGSVAVAAASYLLVERPALRLKDPKPKPGAAHPDGDGSSAPGSTAPATAQAAGPSPSGSPDATQPQAVTE